MAHMSCALTMAWHISKTFSESNYIYSVNHKRKPEEGEGERGYTGNTICYVEYMSKSALCKPGRLHRRGNGWNETDDGGQRKKAQIRGT